MQNCSLQLFYRKSNSQANELFKLFKWLHLYLIPYELKYSTASTLHSPCGLGISSYTTPKVKFLIKDFFSKCDQIRSFLLIWSHLLKKFYAKQTLFTFKLSGSYWNPSFISTSKTILLKKLLFICSIEI